MKVLLVEDDKLLSTTLTKVLSTNHYILDKAEDEQAGLNLAAAIEYDLILLGFEETALNKINLCRSLRSQGYSKPILVMTTSNNDAFVITLFDAGVDDYISKPFTPEVLLAKMRTLLRRSNANAPNSSPLKTTTLTWDKLCLNLDSGRVTVDDIVVALTATEYNLLELFLFNPNRIFSRSAILDKLWGIDNVPTDRAIITHIKDLRKKLKASGLVEDLIETVYGMGYRLKSVPQSKSSKDKSINKLSPDTKHRPTLDEVTKRFQDTFNSRIAVLEQAKDALLTGYPVTHLQAAKQEAHKLAGSLATFGYPDGSKLARSLEHLLENLLEHLLISDSTFTPLEIERYCELLRELKQVLETASVQKTASELSSTRLSSTKLSSTRLSSTRVYQVLVIDDDVALTEQLKAESPAWGVQMKIVSNITTALTCLKETTPDLVLLDLSFPNTESDGFSLLSKIKERSPNLPVIIFTGRDSLTDRLAAIKLGARKFLHKPATSEQIFQTITEILSTSVTSDAKVLIVDDDRTVLAFFSSILTPWGLDVVTLSEPQKFWEVLVSTVPNLILLDLEMPNISGLELCQVVRQDSQWGNLPILVVTAHTDADSLVQAFAAGADDFITKPVLGPELVTRVLSRI